MINLTQLRPVTSENLLKTYFREGELGGECCRGVSDDVWACGAGKNQCFYGVCHYCKPEERACGEGEMMEGSLTLWLPDWYQLKTRRHPYQRTYRQGHRARCEPGQTPVSLLITIYFLPVYVCIRWEVDDGYCQSLLQPSSEYYHGILEFTDTAIYDFLMGMYYHRRYSVSKNNDVMVR